MPGRKYARKFAQNIFFWRRDNARRPFGTGVWRFVAHCPPVCFNFRRSFPPRPPARKPFANSPPAAKAARFCALLRNTPITAIISVTRRAQSACFARFARSKPLFCHAPGRPAPLLIRLCPPKAKEKAHGGSFRRKRRRVPPSFRIFGRLPGVSGRSRTG